MAFEKPAVVIDNGSFNIKAGFSCDNHPVSIFRTLIGRPKWLNGTFGKEFYDVFIGDDAFAHSYDLDLSPPVVDGKIVHWDNMERVWHHIFYRELKCAPEDRAVIMAVASTSTIQEKTRCCEVFFETLNAPGLCVQAQPVLALYGSGVTTGICIDVGNYSTNINPVFEGGLIPYAHMKTCAGAQISNYIRQSFTTRELDFEEVTEKIIEDIKRNHCFVTMNATINTKQIERPYRLWNGEHIDIGLESFAPEILFQPNLMTPEPECLSLQEAVNTSALKCDPEVRAELYDALVPCGSVAAIPGFFDRFQDEMEKTAGRPVEVMRTTEPYCVAWLGAAAFTTLPEVEKVWVMKKQFEEHGERIVRKKF